METLYALLPVVNDDRRIIVDACDYPILCRYRWYIPKGTYAGTPRPFTIVTEQGRKRQVRLARAVTKAPHGLYPRHLNGNALDCRRKNLLLVSRKDDAV